jgi:1-phosphofructokinase family hexose kinase
VLRTLGEMPQWIGPCGGVNGEELVAGLSALGIEPHAFRVKGNTRTNLELIDDAGKVTEILESGPELSAEEIDGFERACRELFEKYGKSANALFSGSLPAGAPEDLYARLIGDAQRAGCKTFLDAGGESLRHGIKAEPDFVKPNGKESAAALKMEIDSVKSAADAAKKLCQLGARRVAISLGPDGLVYIDGVGKDVLHAAAVELKAKSTVGAGDSAFAGFAKGVANGLSAQETLRLAVACAAANCIADSPGAARLADIERFRDQVKVQTVGAGS